MKRQRAAKRHRVTFEPAGAIACALMELLQQARLADAWIPDEEHRLAAALLRLGEQILEQLQLARPRDERRRAARGIQQPGDTPRAGTQPVRTRDRFEREAPIQKGLRLRRHQQRLARGARTQLGEHPIRRPTRVGVELDTTPESTDEHLVRVQGDSELR